MWPADEAYKYNKVNSIIPTLAHSFSCLRAVCVKLKYSFPTRQRSYYFGGVVGVGGGIDFLGRDSPEEREDNGPPLDYSIICYQWA